MNLFQMLKNIKFPKRKFFYAWFRIKVNLVRTIGIQLFSILLVDGEHIFLTDDTKLLKVAPQSWKDDKPGNMPFTLYFRVKYYVENINDIK